MSTTVQVPPRVRLAKLPIDQDRGVNAMWAVVATETMLFVCMFGAYYYLGTNVSLWSLHPAPELLLPMVLLVILLMSSVILAWGERQMKAQRHGAGNIALWVTVLLGLVFLGLQAHEYVTEWKKLAPYSDAYGSIFYTITSLHGAHVVVGLLLLIFVGILPRSGTSRRSPHSAYRTVALYWHFVDVVWIVVVLLLYVAPNIKGHPHG